LNGRVDGLQKSGHILYSKGCLGWKPTLRSSVSNDQSGLADFVGIFANLPTSAPTLDGLTPRQVEPMNLVGDLTPLSSDAFPTPAQLTDQSLWSGRFRVFFNGSPSGVTGVIVSATSVPEPRLLALLVLAVFAVRWLVRRS
jgi:hypothetical protein